MPVKIQLRTLLHFLLPLVGFLIILMGMNVYQYTKVKVDIAGNIIKQISEKERSELLVFFDSIDRQLNLIRQWGLHDVLKTGSVVELTKKFIPLLETHPEINGLLLADNSGHEFFLYKNDDLWVTRMATVSTDNTTFQFQQWNGLNSPGKKWQETSDYTPLNRPWFHSPQQSFRTHWTDIYSFFQQQQKGITASAAWEDPKDPKKFYVVALDILLSQFQQFLSLKDRPASSSIFLLNPQKNIFISSDSSEIENLNQPSITSQAVISPLMKAISPDKLKSGEPVRFNVAKKPWAGAFLPLATKQGEFWLAMAAPEEALTTELNKVLFKVEALDIVMGLIGALLLLFIVWRTLGFRNPVEVVKPAELRLHEVIENGEGAEVEFKSSIRMNLKTGQKGKEIELAWLKAIVAFLNSKGGTLLIGVNDEGKVIGLEQDLFENDDLCLLHLKNLLNQHVGPEFSDSTTITLVASDQKKVAMLECRPANEPVFLKIGKNEEFYIRSGPSSTKLSPRQMVSFVQQKKK